MDVETHNNSKCQFCGNHIPSSGLSSSFCNIICQTASTSIIAQDHQNTQTQLLTNYLRITEISTNQPNTSYHQVFDAIQNKEVLLKIERQSQLACNDLNIASKLSNTPGFVPLLHYHYIQNSMEYFKILQHMDGSLHQMLNHNRHTMNRIEKLYFLFEIIYTLNTAHKQFGFIHGNISTDNILYLSNQPARVYQLRNNSIKIIVPGGSYQPFLTNCDHSQLTHGELNNIAFFDLLELSAVSTLLFIDFRTNSPNEVYRLGDFSSLLDDRNYDRLLDSIYDRIIELKNESILNK